MLLFHRQAGPADAPQLPIVLLHGLLGSSRNWQSTAADLAQQRRLFTLDLRNHGQSDHGTPMDYDTMAADVLAWLDRQGLDRVHLIGHSMGGKVAMVLAVRHPARLASLGLVDIAPRDYHSMSHRAEFAAMNELDLRTLNSRAEAELKLEARVDSWAMRKFLVTNLERDETGGGWRWTVNLPVLTAALPTLEANPLQANERYDGPAHLWRGGRSHYVREQDLEALRRHFAACGVTTLAESGHNPHMETRPAFVAAVKAFLDPLP